MSMELQERLKQDMIVRCEEVKKAVAESAAQRIQNWSPAENGESEDAEDSVVRAHAEDAAAGLVIFLKEFHGELSPEQLSQHVRDIIHSDELVGREDTAFRRMLRAVVPAERADWLADDVEKHISLVRKQSGSVATRAIAIAKQQLARTQTAATHLMTRSSVIVKEPRLHAASLSAAAGAIALGAVGGAVGAGSGAGLGLATGVVGAPFSFGLTLPLGGVVGGGVGLCAGAAVGGGTGAVVAGTTGYAAYTYRVQIKDGVMYVKMKVTDGTEIVTLKLRCTAASIHDQALKKGASTKNMVLNIVGEMKTRAVDSASLVKAKSLSANDAARLKIRSVASYTKAKASELGDKLKENKVVAGSTVVLGAAGGAAGTGIGGVAGAAVGLPAALFTFGLSVPICSAVGSGVGLCTGAVVGGGAGAAAGTAFNRRSQIKDKACGAWGKVHDGVVHVKGKAIDTAFAVQERLVGGTGGTEA